MKHLKSYEGLALANILYYVRYRPTNNNYQNDNITYDNIYIVDSDTKGESTIAIYDDHGYFNWVRRDYFIPATKDEYDLQENIIKYNL